MLVVVIQGCATKPAPPPTAAAPTTTPAAPAPAARPAALLATEREWLQSWFVGTPVVIAQQADGTVTIDVPREFCFDPGRSQVKPPLAAVLDKLAQSLRRSAATLQGLAAPGDSVEGSRLALQRATQLRMQLLSRGVPADRLGTPTATTAAAVQLRMALTPR